MDKVDNWLIGAICGVFGWFFYFTAHYQSAILADLLSIYFFIRSF